MDNYVLISEKSEQDFSCVLDAKDESNELVRAKVKNILLRKCDGKLLANGIVPLHKAYAWARKVRLAWTRR